MIIGYLTAHSLNKNSKLLKLIMNKKQPPKPPSPRTIGGDKTDKVLFIAIWCSYFMLCIAMAVTFVIVVWKGLK